MYTIHAAIFFAVMTGIASSGLIGSVWAAFAGDPPRVRLLFADEDFYTPLRVCVVILSLPTMLLSAACWWLIVRPPIGLILMFFGFLWSFVQGVFIMTQLFHIT
jgi:hypothetical protein